MKKTFLTGLAILLPITITLFIVIFVVDLVTAPFIDFAQEMISHYGKEVVEIPHSLLLIISRLVILILFFITVFLLGMMGRRLFFSWVFKITNHLLTKIPIVKTIYRISRDITKNIFKTDKKNLFKGTALVPFPNQKTHALGLISGCPPKEIQTNRDKRIENKTFQSVFVPTAPHPISGFLLMYSDHEIKTVDIKTEDVFKFLISCGIFQPDQKDEAIKKQP